MNKQLDEKLTSGGKYKQNQDKQVWQPTFVGQGSNGEVKHLRMLKLGCDLVARYLGNLFHSRGGLVAERERMLQAARQGFYEMGKFWWSKSAWSLCRIICRASVESHLLTGAGPMIFKDLHHAQFDKMSIGLSRRMRKHRIPNKEAANRRANHDTVRDTGGFSSTVMRHGSDGCLGTAVSI
jgi:hypothetical protein